MGRVMRSEVAKRLAAAEASRSGADLAMGVVVAASGDRLEVNVGGSQVEARWLLGAGVPDADDVVLCARLGGRWYVFGRSHAQPVSPPLPPPPRGTVTSVPTGSSTIGVSVPGHGTMLCPFLDSYTPSVGNTVVLNWHQDDSVPTVLGRPGSTPTPRPPDPPPPERPPPPSNPTPPPVTTGRSRFAATDSRTRISAGWSTNHGRHVMQGSWAGLAFTGGWFYGTRPRSTLRGRTVTGARVRLGARRRVGYYNQSLTLTLRRHTHTSRPSGGMSLAGGSETVSLPVNAGARWVSIPASWAQEIIDNGGGIALVGTGQSNYGGVVGAGSGSGLDPESGLLEISWRR